MCQKCLDALANASGAEKINIDELSDDARKKVIGGLKEIVGGLNFEESDERTTERAIVLARKILVEAVAKDEEKLLNDVAAACSNQKLAGATLLSLATELDMVLSEVWGITDDVERVKKLAEFARNAMEREMRKEEASADPKESSTEQKEENVGAQ